MLSKKIREDKLILKIVGALFFIIGMTLLINAIMPINKSEYAPEEKELLPIRNHLINPPKILLSGGKASSRYILIEMNGYPGATFKNEHIFLKATNWEAAIKDIKYTDTITLKVSKKAFEETYIKKKKSSKYSFYSLVFNGKEYVSNIYDTAKKDRKEGMIPRICICLVLITIGIICVKIKSG
jgi:hypothetical protein